MFKFHMMLTFDFARNMDQHAMPHSFEHTHISKEKNTSMYFSIVFPFDSVFYVI